MTKSLLLVVGLFSFIAFAGQIAASQNPVQVQKQITSAQPTKFPSPPVGAETIVHLEGNSTMNGKFVAMNQEWVVLKTPDIGEGKEFWLERKLVQMIEFERK